VFVRFVSPPVRARSELPGRPKSATCSGKAARMPSAPSEE